MDGSGEAGTRYIVESIQPTYSTYSRMQKEDQPKGKDVGSTAECTVPHAVARHAPPLAEAVLVGVGMKNGCCVAMRCAAMLGDKCCR